MNNDNISMFSEETYIELMNVFIKENENYVDGMCIRYIRSGIALVNIRNGKTLVKDSEGDFEDITTQEPIMLLEAHTKVEELVKDFLKHIGKNGFNSERLNLVKFKRSVE